MISTDAALSLSSRPVDLCDYLAQQFMGNDNVEQ